MPIGETGINKFIESPYHMVIQRKNQVLLSFLKIRAIVNGREIYPLLNTKPVVIPVEKNHPKVVVTDGYHFTRPLKLVYKDMNIYCFKVSCGISDLQLLFGFIALMVFYVSGLYTGLLILKVASFIPLVYLLFYYYLNREQFIRLIPVVD